MSAGLRICVTGAAGLLGAHLAARLSRDHDVVGLDRHEWWGDASMPWRTGELTDARYRAAMWRDVRPDVLVHCAALTDVDRCQREPASAYEINDQLTGLLAKERPEGCRIVYISTDAVFPGTAPFAAETDVPCPPNVYGRSKLAGEWNVCLDSAKHLIVRTNFYGWSSGRKKTAAEWLVGALEARQPITLFHDVFFTPIYVGDLASRIASLIESGAAGLLHVAGRDRVSKLEFGRMVAQAGGLSMDHVTAGSIRDAALAAPRSPDLSLAAEKCAAIVGASAPGVAEGASRFLADRSVPLSVRGSRVPA